MNQLRKFAQEAAANPWKSYKKVASIAFGTTFVGCTATTVAGQSRISPVNNPELFAGTLLAKCVIAGVIWPAVPFRMIYDPSGIFIVGSSIDKFQEKIEEMLSE